MNSIARSEFKAFIFDMDDTLIASAPLWHQAEETLLCAIGQPGFPLSELCKGMKAHDVADTAHRELNPDLAVSECRSIMREQLLSNFETMPLHEIPGATSLVKRIAALQAPVAVASGSPLPAIERVLSHMGIREHITVLLSSESVKRGKPHPDVFLEAARLLSTPPERCLVFEDSLHGMRAAHAARMRCVVRPSLTKATWAEEAWQTVRHWDQFDVACLSL